MTCVDILAVTSTWLTCSGTNPIHQIRAKPWEPTSTFTNSDPPCLQYIIMKLLHHSNAPKWCWNYVHHIWQWVPLLIGVDVMHSWYLSLTGWAYECRSLVLHCAIYVAIGNKPQSAKTMCAWVCVGVGGGGGGGACWHDWQSFKTTLIFWLLSQELALNP